jgi:RNA 2',3'-cyclic 3'-phosphodiesterase
LASMLAGFWRLRVPESEPSKARLFVAVELTSGVKGELARLQERLKKTCGFCPARWVSVDNIHLTLNFLGDVDISLLKAVKATVKQAGDEFPPFELSMTDTGVFPNLERPHVVWVGLGGDTSKLAAVQKRLEGLVEVLGFRPEDRSFSPHLTLARVRDEATPADIKRLGEAIGQTRCEKDCSIPIDSISLIRSQLTPDGPIYTVIFNAPLAG